MKICKYTNWSIKYDFNNNKLLGICSHKYLACLFRSIYLFGAVRHRIQLWRAVQVTAYGTAWTASTFQAYFFTAYAAVSVRCFQVKVLKRHIWIRRYIGPGNDSSLTDPPWSNKFIVSEPTAINKTYFTGNTLSCRCCSGSSKCRHLNSASLCTLCCSLSWRKTARSYTYLEIFQSNRPNYVFAEQTLNLLSMWMKTGICKTFAFIFAKKAAVTQYYVIDFVARAFSIQSMPFLLWLLTFPVSVDVYVRVCLCNKFGHQSKTKTKISRQNVRNQAYCTIYIRSMQSDGLAQMFATRYFVCLFNISHLFSVSEFIRIYPNGYSNASIRIYVISLEGHC